MYAGVVTKAVHQGIHACVDLYYFLDKELSDKQHTVFYNSTAKKAIVPFIGIDVRVPDWILSDL